MQYELCIMNDELKKLYVSFYGQEPATCEALPGAGSNRRYYRLRNEAGDSVIGVVGTSREENQAFCFLSRHFCNLHLPVPQVYTISSDFLCYLQQDLGDRSLFEALKKGRESGGYYSEQEKELLRRTIALLPDIQMRGAQELDYSQCYPQPSMDAVNVLFDLNYFKYCFLKATELDFHEIRLQEVFQQMATDLTHIPATAFMYRDFQARNVMLDGEGNPFFIDFQGGRRGPVQYDVASFLWQASALYGQELRQELIQVYLDGLRKYVSVDEDAFRRDLQLCVLFRLLQVLGAYGFRGYFQRKKHFLDSIPPAIANLRELLALGGCSYPYLHELLCELTRLPRFAPKLKPSVSQYDGKGPLVVRVFSFSYRKGIPQDESGNGGGYVFDCRSTHNPGRYDAYKQLTGLDEPVIRFLEDDGEILTFLDSVYQLADAHVRRYIERGFTSLMFSFGCTGGQHRSVYSAQHLAQHIHDKFGIEVQLCHRELAKFSSYKK